MTFNEYKTEMQFTNDYEAAKAYIDYFPEAVDVTFAKSLVKEFEQNRPFEVGDKVFYMRNGIEVVANYRGLDKNGMAVIATRTGQFTVDKGNLVRK